MSDYKELWFVRHTETVSPKDASDNDFDLSHKGKYHARMLGWYMAQQELLLPLVILHLDVRRANTMADLLSFHHTSEQVAKSTDITLTGEMPNDTEEMINVLLATTHKLDELTDKSDSKRPNTAIFILHRRHALVFDVLRYLWTSADAKLLRTLSDEQFSEKKQELAESYFADYRGYGYGEAFRMRFPVSCWKDINFGEGKLISRATTQSMRPEYQAWRKNQRVLRLQQPAQ